MDKSKRALISGEWLGDAARASTSKSSSSQHYFDSFESCYPLLASAGPLLIDEARANGIDTEGKSPEAIARELFDGGFIFPKDV